MQAENMATYIGYPNELLEEWKVSDIYNGVNNFILFFNLNQALL